MPLGALETLGNSQQLTADHCPSAQPPEEIEQFLGGNLRISREETKNSSEVSFDSSEVLFHSSEVLFHASVENFHFLPGKTKIATEISEWPVLADDTIGEKDRRAKRRSPKGGQNFLWGYLIDWLVRPSGRRLHVGFLAQY